MKRMFIASILAAIGVSAATPLFLTLDQPSLNKYLLGNGGASEAWGHYLAYESYVDGSGNAVPETVEYYISCTSHKAQTEVPASLNIVHHDSRPVIDVSGMTDEEIEDDVRFGERRATPTKMKWNGSSTVTGNANSTGAIVIPATYGETSVTMIAEGAFSGKSSITSVYIPSTITTIGANAFNSCGLESVVVPSTVASVDYSVFADCSAMTSAEFYANCAIPSDAFLGCRALATVHIGSGVTSIASGAFSETIVSNVYYHGTSEQWAALPKGENCGLEGATVHYV